MQYAHVRLAGVLMLGYFALRVSATSETWSGTDTTESLSAGASRETITTEIHVTVQWKIPKGATTWFGKFGKRKMVEKKEHGTLDWVNGKILFDENEPSLPLEWSSGGQLTIELPDESVIVVEVNAINDGDAALLLWWKSTFRKTIKIPVLSIDGANDYEDHAHKPHIEFQDLIPDGKFQPIAAPQFITYQKTYNIIEMFDEEEMTFTLSEPNKEGRVQQKPILMKLEIPIEEEWALQKLKIQLNHLARFHRNRQSRETRPRRVDPQKLKEREERLKRFGERKHNKQTYDGPVFDIPMRSGKSAPVPVSHTDGRDTKHDRKAGSV